jgi:trehalose 6-phosphate synthase
MDYTKGLDEKVRAVERLLEVHPEFRERLVLAQIAEPSRTGLAAYQAYRSRLAETTRRVNARFGTASCHPITLLEAHYEPAEVYRFLRAADICYVGSLHDGMNLVAKEFVAARDDHRGVLILSRFAGAARELTAALVVNPYAVDDCAEAVAKALRMSDEEQSTRMRAMRSVVAEFNTYRWAGDMLGDAARLRADLTQLQDQQTPWQRELLRASV